mgnify:CR=1 FL=1
MCWRNIVCPRMNLQSFRSRVFQPYHLRCCSGELEVESNARRVTVVDSRIDNRQGDTMYVCMWM